MNLLIFALFNVVALFVINCLNKSLRNKKNQLTKEAKKIHKIYQEK